MAEKKLEKLHLENLWIRYSDYGKTYSGSIEFANKKVEFKLQFGDEMAKRLIALLANEIQEAKDTLAQEMVKAIEETTEEKIEETV